MAREKRDAKSISEQQKQTALLKAIEMEKEYILNDMPSNEFLNTYCYIESKDDPGNPVIKFNMWPSQEDALDQIIHNKLNIVLKARQLGFTWMILCYISHLVLKHQGYTALILSETEEKSKELINRVDFILRHMPPWLILEEKKVREFEKQYGKGTYTGLLYIQTTTSIEIIRPNGEKSYIKAQPATQGAGRSLTGDIVFFDEWAFHKFAADIFTAAYPTMNRPTSGKFVGLSTNLRGSFFEHVWKNADAKGFHKIFLNCFADPRRTEEWYEESAKALGSKVQQEYPRTEQDALMAGENVSFPEWSYEIHVCEPFDIPLHWRRFGSVDNGYNDPFAWYKYAISDDGIVYMYYEQSRWRDEPQVGYSDQAREYSTNMFFLNEETGKMDKEKLDYIVAGLDAWHGNHRDNMGKNLIDYYRDGGLNEGFIPAIVDRKLRKATFHEYLKPFLNPLYTEGGDEKQFMAKLQVFNTCTYFIDIMPQLVNDDREPDKVADLSDIDNPYDSGGYGLISHHASKSTKKVEEEKTVQQKHKERLMRGYSTRGSKRRYR